MQFTNRLNYYVQHKNEVFYEYTPLKSSDYTIYAALILSVTEVLSKADFFRAEFLTQDALKC